MSKQEHIENAKELLRRAKLHRGLVSDVACESRIDKALAELEAAEEEQALKGKEDD